MAHRFRRVVTGHDAQGRSTFVFDGIAASTKDMASIPGLVLTDLWETTTAPASNSGNDDAAARPVRLEPPQAGSIFRMVEFPPDSHWKGRLDVDAAEAFASIGGEHTHVTDMESDPMRHKTSTIDYIIVLKGEVYAVLDTGETLLKPGDVLIQRGTVHSWSVRGNQPCIIAGILVGATPYSMT